MSVGFDKYRDLLPFVADHYNDNLHELLLSSARYPGVDMKVAVAMISARRKIDIKVQLWKGTKNLCFPDPVAAEQSSSMESAKYKKRFISNQRVLDLTCGVGIDSIFISENASEVYCYERNPLLCAAFEHNVNILGIKNVNIINREIDRDWIESYDGPAAGLIYLDPARRLGSGKRVIALEDYQPDILKIKNSLLKIGKKILIKISPMVDISATIKQFPETVQIHIISVENECKELLFLLDPDVRMSSTSIDQEIFMINLNKKGIQEFSCTIKSEKESDRNQAVKGPEEYIYEPNSSIMKGGAFKSLSCAFNLRILAPSTHIYTSSELINDFPGRIFRLKQVHSAGKKGIKEIRSGISRANVSVRNFPLSASDLKKLTGLKDGGDIYLMGCTLYSGQKVILEASKVY